MIDTNILSKHIPNDNKNVVLTKKFKKTVYSLSTRTTAQMVYMDDTFKYTLHEMITDIIQALVTDSKRITGVSERLDVVLKDAPEEYDTLLEIWNYINLEGHSELADALRDRYTKDEVDALIQEINDKIDNTPNAIIVETDQPTIDVRDNDIYYQIEEDEVGDVDAGDIIIDPINDGTPDTEG